jgi:hypothetical protein
MFELPLKYLYEIFFILRIIERDSIKNVLCSSSKVPVFFLILIKLECSCQNLEKIFKFQILWKSVQWEPSCSMRTDGRTNRRSDRNKEANSRFSQFYEWSYKLHDIGSAVHSKNGRSSVEPLDTELADGLYCDLLMIVTVLRVSRLNLSYYT